jgi:hypothetical protein
MVYGVSLEIRTSEQGKQRKQRATTNPIMHDETEAFSSILREFCDGLAEISRRFVREITRAPGGFCRKN